MDEVALKKLPPVMKTTFPKKVPYKAEKFDKSFKTKRVYELYCPNQNEASNSVINTLLNEKKNLYKAEMLLKERREKRKNLELKYDKKWKDIYKFEKNFREFILDNEKFVTENGDKRFRLRRKIEDDRKIQQTRDQAIKDMTKELSCLSEVKQTIESHMNNCKIYEDFILMVLDKSNGQFRTSSDIVRRYVLLMDKRKECSEKREKQHQELEKAKNNLVAFIDNQLLGVMILSERAMNLSKRHDDAKSKALRWEGTVNAIKEQLELKYMELQTTTASIWNIYKQVCARKKVPIMKDNSQIDAQLHLISKAIVDAEKVYKVAKRNISKENRTNCTIIPSQPSRIIESSRKSKI